MISRILSGLLLILMTSVAPAFAADARMRVEVLASDGKGSSLNELQANIPHAAKLALPLLWNRIIPRHARDSMPARTKALMFIQRAGATNNGASILFHEKRVLSYLKSNELPYIEQEPVWNISIQLRNEFGRAMPLSASLLLSYAEKSAIDWGYKLDNSGHSLILQWQWLNYEQVNLIVRGTSKLGEFSETRLLAVGDPLPQLEEWLLEVLLKARDAHAEPQEETTLTLTPDATPAAITEFPQQEVAATESAEQPFPSSQDSYLLLSIERQASLPEQVLFEDDLKHEPHVISLSLKQVNRNLRQYRLHLQDSDGQWLIEWFRQRELELSPTSDGWVAR